MMLDWIGDRRSDLDAKKAAVTIEKGVDRVLMDPQYHTADMGGKAFTEKVGDAVANEVSRLLKP